MPRVWTSLKYRAEYVGFLLAGLIFRSMRVEAASALSGWLWRHVAPWLHRHGRALRHLEMALPETTPAERETIARGMWENLGRTFAEAFHLKSIVAEGRIVLKDKDVLERWVNRKGAKLACTGHLANWELASAGFTGYGLRPWGLYQRVKNPLVNRRIAEMRAFIYTGGLVQKGPSVPRLFMRVAREGGAIGFMGDLCDPGGIEVPFFGMPAPTTQFPGFLARAVEAPLLIAHLRRLPGVRFEQTFELLETPVTDDRHADVEALTTMIQAALERCVRETPEQWTWAHRRWGRRVGLS